ncbi:MAG: NADH-quinone oxidoreductase subunit J [Thermoanaerobaculia bacterium]
MTANVLFYIFLILTLLFGLFVALFRSPLYSLLSLLGVVSCLSVLFYFYGATFISFIQLIVYAGGILVLFLFVIMLLKLQPEERGGEHPLFKVLAPILFFAFTTAGISILFVHRIKPVEYKFYVEMDEFSYKLFTDYGLPFEAITLLLLASAVGAFIIAKRKI